MMRVAFFKRRQRTFAYIVELRLGLSGAGGGAYTYTCQLRAWVTTTYGGGWLGTQVGFRGRLHRLYIYPAG